MNRAFVLAVIVALLSGVLTVVGALLQPERAAYSYLVAFAYWCTLALGALLVVIMAHAARARWLIVWRRLAELVAASLPVFLVLFVPIVIAIPALYPWGRIATLSEEAKHLVEHRHAFVNPFAFILRAVFYFAVWGLLSESLLRLSLAVEREPSAALIQRQFKLAALGVPLFAFTLTLSSFDWYMSLSPSWASTTFGVYIFAGAFVSALALLSFLGWRGQRAGALTEVPRPEHYRALGRLTFAMVIFWAYIAYTQFFIVWIADLPEEVAWYQPRVQGAWQGLSIVLLFAHFVLPFFALLPKWLKASPRYLAAVAVWLLACHYGDIYWIVMPERGAPDVHWLDVTSWLFVGAVVVAVVLVRARRGALLPVGDPRFADALGYHGA